jgi:hypothetical protein
MLYLSADHPANEWARCTAVTRPPRSLYSTSGLSLCSAREREMTVHSQYSSSLAPHAAAAAATAAEGSRNGRWPRLHTADTSMHDDDDYYANKHAEKRNV